MSAWTRPFNQRGRRGRLPDDDRIDHEPVRKRDDPDSEEEHEYVFGGESDEERDEGTTGSSHQGAPGESDMAHLPQHVRAVLSRLTCDQDEQNEQADVFVGGGSNEAAHEDLTYNPAAYDFFSKFSTDWPLLSIDAVVDPGPLNRSEYPHRMLLLGGTQTDGSGREPDSLCLFSISNVYPTADGELDAEDEADRALEPQIEVRKLDCSAPVNRVRSFTGVFGNAYCAGNPGLAVFWTADGFVEFHSLDAALQSLGVRPPDGQDDYNLPASSFANSEGGWCGYTIDSGFKGRRQTRGVSRVGARSPSLLYSYENPGSVEGYALACCPTQALVVAGDVAGAIRAFRIKPDGTVLVDAGSTKPHGDSVEDAVFARCGQAFLNCRFATASCDRSVIISDPRVKGGRAARFRAHEADVNVLDWSYFDENALLTGGEEGGVRLWDLRNTQEPLKAFKYHSGPITSVRFSPNEPTVFASLSSDGLAAIWDYDIEGPADPDGAGAEGTGTEGADPAEVVESAPSRYPEATRKALGALPPELVFLHMGLEDPKELAFHPQIPGCIAVTDLSGLQLFKPINVGHIYEDEGIGDGLEAGDLDEDEG